MIRVRLAGGVCTPGAVAEADGARARLRQPSLRLTTRQTFQFHGILKRNLKHTIQGLERRCCSTPSRPAATTLAASCASVNPHLSALHREVLRTGAADFAMQSFRGSVPITRSGWTGRRRSRRNRGAAVYGPTYLPRKFKIGFVIPPVNDIDVYTQDVGFIAIAEGESLAGFNLTVGGGMGRTDRTPHTYPAARRPDRVSARRSARWTSRGRSSRSRATSATGPTAAGRASSTRSTTRASTGSAASSSGRLGFALEPARDFVFTTNGDEYGWNQGSDGAGTTRCSSRTAGWRMPASSG